MSKPVRKTLADCELTPASKRQLAELTKRPDSAIDFSDIPSLTESFWKKALRNPFYRPVKQRRIRVVPRAGSETGQTERY